MNGHAKTLFKLRVKVRENLLGHSYAKKKKKQNKYLAEKRKKNTVGYVCQKLSKGNEIRQLWKSGLFFPK